MDIALGTALIGAICGPAVARAAYRLSVPAGEPLRTSCSHCDEELSPSLVARVGWAGRCEACKAAIGPPVWLVALLGLAAGALVGWRLGNDPSVVVFLAFALACVLLALVDVAVQRLPDVLTGPLAAVGVVGLSTTSYLAQDMSPVLRGLIGAALAGGFFLAIAWVSAPSDGMGLGDAKLAAVLGLFLGWLSWRDLTLGVLAGTLLAVLYAGVMVLTGRMDRKSPMTYGPFLMVGAALALLLG